MFYDKIGGSITLGDMQEFFWTKEGLKLKIDNLLDGLEEKRGMSWDKKTEKMKKAMIYDVILHQDAVQQSIASYGV